MLKNGNSDKARMILPIFSHSINAFIGASLFISHEISPNMKYIITRKMINPIISPFIDIPFFEPNRITKGISMAESRSRQQKIVTSSKDAEKAPPEMPYVTILVRNVI